MVAGNVPVAEFESNAQWDSAAEDVLALTRVSSRTSKADAAHLHSFLAVIDRLIANIDDETRRLRQFVERDQTSESLDLEAESDDSLLDHARRFLDFSATYRRRIELLNRWHLALGQLADRSGEHAAAQSRAARLAELISLYETLEQSLRNWSDQLCREYARRHPDLTPPSIQPVELGIGDSAALPEVL